MEQALAALLAFAAAIAYPTGTALQQKANLLQLRSGPDVTAAEAARAVLRTPLWWGGLATSTGGFAFQAVALGLGALVLVQPILMAQLVFMVPAGAWVVGGRMTGREWLGAILAMLGLAAVLLAVQLEAGLDAGNTRDWLIALAVCTGSFAVLWLAAPYAGQFRAALLGSAAGIVAGTTAAVVKQVTADVSLTNWALYAVAILGITTMALANVAIRAGRLSTAQTLIAVVSTVVSLAIAVTVFQETMTLSPAGLLGVAAGTAAMALGVTMLARSPSLLALDEAAAETAGTPS